MKADVRKPEDVAEAFQKFDEKRTEVAIILQSNLLFLEQANIAAAAATTRVPTVYGYRVHVDAGGLISYVHAAASIGATMRKRCARHAETIAIWNAVPISNYCRLDE